MYQLSSDLLNILHGWSHKKKFDDPVCRFRKSKRRCWGVIPTFFDKNTRVAEEITDDIIKYFGKDRI